MPVGARCSAPATQQPVAGARVTQPARRLRDPQGRKQKMQLLCWGVLATHCPHLKPSLTGHLRGTGKHAAGPGSRWKPLTDRELSPFPSLSPALRYPELPSTAFLDSKIKVCSSVGPTGVEAQLLSWMLIIYKTIPSGSRRGMRFPREATSGQGQTLLRGQETPEGEGQPRSVNTGLWGWVGGR